MIALLDNGPTQEATDLAGELGCEIGQLLTPLTRYYLRNPDRPWAIDNGAYSGLDIPAFHDILAREQHHREKCLFVTVPDVLGSARRTLELFDYWRPKLDGWKLALACQDGQEHLPIPWDAIDAVFIGGSTNWKCGDYAAQIVRAAKAMDKWVHIGRVNHGARFVHFEKLDADSFDGSGISRFTWQRERIRDRHVQGGLDLICE